METSNFFQSAVTMINRAGSVVTIVLWSFSLLAAGLVVASARRYEGIDFYQYWSVGKILAGAAPGNAPLDLYGRGKGDAWENRVVREFPCAGGGRRWRSAAAFRRELEIYSSPFLYALFSPLALLPYSRALDLFQAAGTAALIVFAAAGGAAARARPWSRPLLLLLILLVYQPAAADLRAANVNRLQLGILGVVFWAGARADPAGFGLAGFLLGLAVAFKPNLAATPALTALALLAWEKAAAAGRFCAGAALGGGAAVGAAAIAWGGTGCWKRWLDAVSAMPPDIIPPRLGNYAPGWYLSRLAGTDLSIPLALGLFGLAAAAVVAGARRRKTNPEIFSSSWQAAAALGPLVFILSSRLVWIHYYLLAVPAALILISPPSKGWQVLLGAAGFALIALDPMLAVIPPPGIRIETLAAGAGTVLLLAGLLGKIAGGGRTPTARRA